jgi:outer membrane protein assembly factor BamB
MKNNHGGVVVIDDHVYGHSEGLGWICQERKSGELKWDERNKFNCTSGAITAADGLLYLYTDGGVVALVEPSPDAFKEISSFTIPEMSKAPQARPTSRQSKIWSHPVVANGRLYLRDTELIFCYEVKAK